MQPKLYKQEGRFSFFQMSLPMLATGKPMQAYFPENYGHIAVYAKDGHGIVYLNEERMHRIAQYFLQNPVFPTDWQNTWEDIDRRLTEKSREISRLSLPQLSDAELLGHFSELWAIDREMWAISIFIDTLDAGDDAAAIEQVAREKGLTSHEIDTYLVPRFPSYVTEWDRALARIAAGSLEADELRETFFWYRTDYAHFGEVTDEFIADAVTHRHQPATTQPAVTGENPLQIFQVLSEWRDTRKRLNFTALYGLLRCVREGMRRKNLDPELSSYLFPSEFADFLNGAVGESLLRERKAGVMFTFDGDTGAIQVVTGAAAEKELVAWQRNYAVEAGEVRGMCASKGTASGQVRIIERADAPEAAAMEKGDILVTSMTRPEFVMLMRKAGAVVTDEGGISCHAAIVSRELGIPCIIGTKNATRLLKNGERVFVNATEGVVTPEP